MARITTRAPYIQCSLLILCKKQLVSEVGTWENDIVLSLFLNVVNVGAERMCSGRLFQATGRATQNVRINDDGLIYCLRPHTFQNFWIRHF